jgi:glycosyltransferase involved in cell wall biosynthesis
MEVARSLGVRALEDNRTKGNIGYGFAHMTGLQAATGDIIATADADGTYPVTDLAKIIDFLIDNDLDFVSCSRYPVQEGTSISTLLKFGVACLNIEARLLYSIKINDILSGMWVLNKRIKDKLNLSEGDWNLSPQIKLNALLNHDIKFAEYPIPQAARFGETKQAYLKTGLSHMWWILKNRLTKGE